MRKGDTLINIDVCAGYTWIENKEEREFLNKNTLALKNGAIINRILIVGEDREEELKNSDILKQYFNHLQPGNKMYLVRKADVIKFCPDDYQKAGSGFGVFNNKLAFIDSYSSVDSIGYSIEGENLLKPLVESYTNILKNIENGNIKKIDIKS